METLKDRVARHEGKKLTPYRCTADKLTIGFGRNYEDNPLPQDIADYLAKHGQITEEMAGRMLVEDLGKCVRQVDHDFPWTQDIESIRREILVEMAFQLGIAGLHKFKNMLACLQAGDIDGATRNMLNSAWHRQTPSRAEELAALMLRGNSAIN